MGRSSNFPEIFPSRASASKVVASKCERASGCCCGAERKRRGARGTVSAVRARSSERLYMSFVKK